MISKKYFLADGSTTNFLSDYIIRNDEYCRVYVSDSYELPVSGTERAALLANVSEWELVNNNIVFYEAPAAGKYVTVWVASTPEELDTYIDYAFITYDNISNIETVVDNMDIINTTAQDITSINTIIDNLPTINDVAAIDSAITEVNDIATEVVAVADIKQEIINVDSNSADISTVATYNSDVSIVSGNIGNVNTAATNIANVNTVAGNITNVNTVAGINNNVTTVANISTDVTAVANIASDIQDVQDQLTNVQTVANDLNESISEIEVVAGSISNVNTVGTNIANVNTVAGISANVTTVAGIDSDVTTVAGNNANVTTVAGISANVTKVANIDDKVTTVANNDTNVTSVADNMTGLNTIVTNMTEILNADTNAATATTKANEASTSASNAAASLAEFQDQYHGSLATAPTSGLDTGDLYFDTTLNEMRVYDGSVWKAAGSTVNGTAQRQTFTATAGQTVFTVTGGYDAGFADVYLNGVKLVNGADVTVTSGTAVVLTTGATAGDIVDVVAYGAFEVANTYTKAEADANYEPLNADLYEKSNILGTVSQSGGVPTGAIIERGSNANGEYVKYADGTLICRTARIVADSTTKTITLPTTVYNYHFDVSVFSSTIPFTSNSIEYAVTNCHLVNSTSVKAKWAQVSINQSLFTVIARWY